MKWILFILIALTHTTADVSASCENIDLSQSTFKNIPIQEQIGGTCYAYTAANLMTGLIQKNQKSNDFCSPLEMASNDRLERVLQNPVGSISSDPFDVELASQLSGGQTCQSLNEVLNRGNCCKKFPFEDHLGLPPEYATPKGLIDGLISLFQSDDLNSDILADHQENRKKLAPRLRLHNQSVHNLRSIIQQAQVNRFQKNGWPESLQPLLQEFEQKHGIKAFDYERFLSIENPEKMNQLFSDQRKIQSHPIFQNAYSEFMNQALSALADPKQRNGFLRKLSDEGNNIDPISEIDFQLLEQVKKEDQKTSERILQFFKSQLKNCKNTDSQMRSVLTLNMIDLLADLNQVEGELPPIDPTQTPDPLVILHAVIQKSCSPLSESNLSERHSCRSVPRSRMRDPLSQTIASLKNTVPVGMSFCAKRLFGSDPSSRNDRDSCGAHGVTLIGVRTNAQGRCQVRIRNSWGTRCQNYVHSSRLQSASIECITRGEHPGDLWVDADLAFSSEILQSLEFIQ